MDASQFFCTFVLVFSFGIIIVHISAKDGLYCPLQIRHLDLDLLQKATNLGCFEKKGVRKKKLKVSKITAEIPKAYIFLTSVSFEQ